MKKGFETLEALLNGKVSGRGGSTGPKMSKAAVLNKAKDHIEKITTEQKRLKTEIDLMRRETDNLQASIEPRNNFQPMVYHLRNQATTRLIYRVNNVVVR